MCPCCLCRMGLRPYFEFGQLETRHHEFPRNDFRATDTYSGLSRIRQVRQTLPGELSGQSGERKACGKGFGDIDFFCVEGETEKDGRGTEIKLCESF